MEQKGKSKEKKKKDKYQLSTKSSQLWGVMHINTF